MSTLNPGGDAQLVNKQTSGGFTSAQLQQANSSSLLSIMSSAKTPRSNSMMISKQTPKNGVSSPTAIEGSFIAINSDARKLSDMGIYRNIGKTSLNKGDSSAIQNLVDRRLRFHSNF